MMHRSPHYGLPIGAFALAICFTGSGCASMISGPTQRIPISSVPSGARISVEPTGFQATTPTDLILRRNAAPYRLTVAHDGYRPQQVVIGSTTNPLLWGNLALTILALWGFAIDQGTGASRVLAPDHIAVQLELVDVPRSLGSHIGAP